MAETAPVPPPGPAPATGSASQPGAAPNAPAPDTSPKFYIRRFRVDGYKAIGGGKPILSPLEIEQIIYPYMGPYRTAQDVEMARAALEKAYIDKGYQTVSVQTPEQSLQQITQKGVVVLKVSQFTVGHLRVVGSRYNEPDVIKQQAPHLAPGTVPNFNDVTKDIVSLNQLPDRQVTPVLRAGETPGTVDVDLHVKDSLPLHGSLEVNNRYSAGTDPLRVTANASYDNLWQLGHSLSLTFQIAPQDPSNALVFSGSYLARIPGIDGLSLLLYGLTSNSNVATVGATNVTGKGQTVGTRAIITLPSDKGFNENISLGMDYKDFQQGVVAPGAPIDDTPITYFPLSATYAANWQGGDGSQTQLDSGVTFNFRGFGSSEQEFAADRYGSSGNFFYFRGDLSRMQPLPKDFQIYAKIQGQLSGEPLINNEQISAGGLDTVRGYLESEGVGDSGFVGQLEIRSPSLAPIDPSIIDEWRFYVFSDAAELGLNQALPEQENTVDLASVGLGSRVKLLDHFNGSLDLAFPMITGPDTQAHDWRLTFRAQATF